MFRTPKTEMNNIVYKGLINNIFNEVENSLASVDPWPYNQAVFPLKGECEDRITNTTIIPVRDQLSSEFENN